MSIYKITWKYLANDTSRVLGYFEGDLKEILSHIGGTDQNNILEVELIQLNTTLVDLTKPEQKVEFICYDQNVDTSFAEMKKDYYYQYTPSNIINNPIFASNSDQLNIKSRVLFYYEGHNYIGEIIDIDYTQQTVKIQCDNRFICHDVSITDINQVVM